MLIVDLKLLVDELELPAGKTMEQYLAEMVSRAGKTENGSAIIDHSVENEIAACREMEDSVSNGTYIHGDFVRDWVAASPIGIEGRYWSPTCGFDRKDLAARYAPTEINRPHPAAIMVIDR